MNELTDENIVKKVQDGDIEMFGILIDRYESKMQRYAKRFLFDSEDTKDLIQDIFTKGYVNIADFDVNRRFSPWIYRIAHNCFVNELKKKKMQSVPVFEIDTFFPHFFDESTPEKETIDGEVRKELESCINKVDMKYKEILILYYFEEMSYKEISDILHIPVSVVGMRLNRGKKAIKKLIKI